MRRWLRIARLALHVARGLLTAAFFFPFQTQAWRNREIRRWARRLLATAEVRLHVHGEIDEARPLMLIANHVSWLDIFAIQSVLPVRFVAKTETRRWPFVGWLSAKAGTFFIDQARRRDTHRINGLVAPHADGARVRWVDLGARFLDGPSIPRPELYNGDLLHLSSAGYEALGEGIAAVIEPWMESP